MPTRRTFISAATDRVEELVGDRDTKDGEGLASLQGTRRFDVVDTEERIGDTYGPQESEGDRIVRPSRKPRCSRGCAADLARAGRSSTRVMMSAAIRRYQASSIKHQASGIKHQALSIKP